MDAMDLTHGARPDAVAPHEHGALAHETDTVRAFRVVPGGGSWVLPLTVLLPDATEAIALFSGEEETRMFWRLHEEDEEKWASSTIGRATAGGVLSMLDCPWQVKHVLLDPLPGFLGERSLGQMVLARERFARGFAGTEPWAVGR